ncbi:hypothetical protein Pdw03_8376 [Penicillium digitatum]|uniref:Uncharacterized protein n=1 Tax=Penicillium digitatum TaxID=36651 RepID=A0A7T6XNG0_PENDI|nr:hypothetical protein Pdw03_8376 [Penicillium digitatum]
MQGNALWSRLDRLSEVFNFGVSLGLRGCEINQIRPNSHSPCTNWRRCSNFKHRYLTSILDLTGNTAGVMSRRVERRYRLPC